MILVFYHALVYELHVFLYSVARWARIYVLYLNHINSFFTPHTNSIQTSFASGMYLKDDADLVIYVQLIISQWIVKSIY